MGKNISRKTNSSSDDKSLKRSWLRFFVKFIVPTLIVVGITFSLNYIRQSISTSVQYLILEVVGSVLIAYFGGFAIQHFNKIANQESDPIYQKGLTSVRTLYKVMYELFQIKSYLQKEVEEQENEIGKEKALSLITLLDFLQADIKNAIIDWTDIFPHVDLINKLLNEKLTLEKNIQKRYGDKNTEKINEDDLNKIENMEERITSLPEPYKQMVASGTGPTAPAEFLVKMGDLTGFGPVGPSED